MVSCRREGVHRVFEAWWRPWATTHGHQPLEPILCRSRHKPRARPARGGSCIMGHRVVPPLPHLERAPGQPPVGHANPVAIRGIEGESHIWYPFSNRPEAASLIPPGADRPSERWPRKTPLLDRAQQPRAAWRAPADSPVACARSIHISHNNAACTADSPRRASWYLSNGPRGRTRALPGPLGRQGSAPAMRRLRRGTRTGCHPLIQAGKSVHGTWIGHIGRNAYFL